MFPVQRTRGTVIFITSVCGGLRFCLHVLCLKRSNEHHVLVTKSCRSLEDILKKIFHTLLRLKNVYCGSFLKICCPRLEIGTCSTWTWFFCFSTKSIMRTRHYHTINSFLQIIWYTISRLLLKIRLKIRYIETKKRNSWMKNDDIKMINIFENEHWKLILIDQFARKAEILWTLKQISIVIL